jgi:PAS domain S-box-containing protein
MSESAKPLREARKRLYDAIRADVPFEQKAQTALELGVEYLDADNGYLTRIDQETDHWEAVVSTDPADGPVPTGLQLDLGTTYCQRTIESDSQIALHDAQNQGWQDEIAFASYGLSCYLGTTLVVDGEEYGTVCFAATEPREEPFSEDETMFAELITRLLERELERDQYEAAFRRQANLSTVLNRVLRHNLRNNMVVIRGHTQLMAEQLDDSKSAEIALRNIDDLIDLGEKARKLEEVVAESADREPTTLRSLLDRAAETVREEYPGTTVTITCDESLAVEVAPSFTQALEELLDNAAKHGGPEPTVDMTVECDGETIEINIADDGPGLSPQEQEVLRDGVETPLVHGTGLGLWLVHWVVTTHGGRVEPTVTDAGTTMTISVPRTAVAESDTHDPKLRRSRDQYQAAFEAANDAMVITDDDGRILDANTSAADIYGLSREAVLGRSITEFFPAEFDFEAEWRAFQTGEKSRDTITIIDIDGEEHTLEYAGTPDVVPGQHLFISRDITERREREAELRMKTEAIDAAPIGITIADPNKADTPLVYVNDKFCEISGYDCDEVIGRNCRFMQGDIPRRDPVRDIRTAIDTGESISTTLKNVRKDGTEFWNHVTIAPVRDDTGDTKYWVGFQRDVTEQRKREDTIEQTTERLESIVSVAPNPIFAVDTEGRITQWNEATEDLFGYTAEEVLGDPIQSLDIIPAEQEFTQHFERAVAGDLTDDIEVRRQTRDGEKVTLRLSPIMLRDSYGVPTGLMIVAEHLR